MADFSQLAGYEPDHDHIGDTDDESDMDYTFEELEDVDVDDEELEGDLVDEHDEEDDDEGGLGTMTVDDLRRLLAARGPLQEVLLRLTPDVMDLLQYPTNSRRGVELPVYREPVPSPEGQELMASGNFGVNESEFSDARSRSYKRIPSLSERLLQRETRCYTGNRARLFNQLLVQNLIPSSSSDFKISSGSRVYSGQFSDDGNFFYSCAQDFCVRMYDTSNPYSWKYYKTLNFDNGSWTLTDATISPDNRHIAYSSIVSSVHLANTSPSDTSDPTILDFHSGAHSYSRFGIWSIRFSGDGTELIAGTSNNSLYVYDIQAQRTTLKLSGHRNDVNAVCYGDKSSPHILYSGSDDTTIKIWDRRSMSSHREVGIFPGHREGITFIDSKGDGRYVLSNAKDQTMKLWDIRAMMSPHEFENLPQHDYSSGFDYRSDPYPDRPARTPHDKSLVTYRGHSVLQTLIRCHFSPATSTGNRYVYTGSADGKVAVYNIDATRAATIDVGAQAVEHGRSGGFLPHSRRVCVRDVSWHPTAPVIAATAWCGSGYGYGGGARSGLVSVHSWGRGGKGHRGEAVTYDLEMGRLEGEKGVRSAVDEWEDESEGSDYDDDYGDMG